MDIALIFLAVIVLVASFVRAVSGFGFALVATPLMTLVMNARSVVVIVMLLGTAAGVMVLYHMRRNVDVSRVIYMGLGAIPGVILGTLLLVRLSPDTIKLWIAVVVFVFAIPLAMGHSHRFQHERIGCLVAGFLSGLLSSSTQSFRIGYRWREVFSHLGEAEDFC